MTDAAALAAAGSDDLTQTWLPLPRPYSEGDALRWIGQVAPDRQRSGFGLVRAIDAAGQLAGTIDFKRTEWAAGVTEIGYLACPWARSQGFVTEAVQAMARWALTDLGLHRVELRIATGNAASLRVAEKAGFLREGVARRAGYIHAGRVDLAIFSLVQADLSL
ncbi:MAG: putative ribosomal N-acetyltransferase ydaF [Frankiales bacterium]|nr:putative ribosomal N-acetyltransferase ydaF [Frankiales bacterium]